VASVVTVTVTYVLSEPNVLTGFVAMLFPQVWPFYWFNFTLMAIPLAVNRPREPANLQKVWVYNLHYVPVYDKPGTM